MNTNNPVRKEVTLKSAARTVLSDYSYWLSFVLLLIIAGSVNTSFFRWSNITNIFVQSTVTGIMALGMSMVISAGMIDISVGAQMALIGGLGIEILNKTQSVMIMLLFCLAFGMVVGTINGLLVSAGNMPPMIATLAMQSICRSVINHLGQGGPFKVTPNTEYYDSFRVIGNSGIGPKGFTVPYLMLIFILMAVLFHVIMSRTRLGKHVYAVGSNETSARLAGVRVGVVKVLVFTITGITCGFAAWLYTSRVMSVAAASTGSMYEMDAIAAVAIGGTSMNGGRGKIIGTFLGALMFKIINNILTMANVPPFLNGAISGGIIIIAVLLQNFQNRRK